MFATFTLGTIIPRGRVRTPVGKLQSFERSRIVSLRVEGWTYKRIAAQVNIVSVVCLCFQQWSMENSHTNRLGSGWLFSTDARQDGRIVRAAVAARTASMEEIPAHVASVVSPRTIGKHLFAAELRPRGPLPRLPPPSTAYLISRKSRLDSGIVLCFLQ